MQRLSQISGCIALCSVASANALCEAQPQPDSMQIEAMARGKATVTMHCQRCHGIGASDDSPHKDAPTFRAIANRYSVWLLAEALAEGILTGHPDMPEFVFNPDEISAILTYMDSLKTNPDE